MAYYLVADRTGQYIQLPNPISVNYGTDAYTIEIKCTMLDSSNNNTLLGQSVTTSTTDNNISFTTSGRLQIAAGGSNAYFTSANFGLFDGLPHVYRLEHDAGGAWRAYRDGALFQSSSYSTSRTGTNPLSRMFRQSTTSATSSWNFYYLTITGFSVNDTWDANLSGGTGSVLPSLSGSNNGTQAGSWPSDDSEWVFYSTGGTTYTLTATGATYSYSGGAATTAYNRVMQAAGGSFSYAGGSATLTYSPAGVVYTLTADSGIYSYSGGGATTAYNRVMAVSGGAFAYSGGSATLSRNYSMAASGGVYNYAGGNAALNYTPATGYRLTALGASFSYAGGDATFTYSQTYPQASASDFTVSGRLSESVSYSAIMYESTTYSGRLN